MANPSCAEASAGRQKTSSAVLNQRRGPDMGESPFSLTGGGRETGAVENARGLVAHLLEDAAYGAFALRHAFLTGGVRRLTDARDERQGTIERANDVADADLARLAPQLVPAVRPFAA